MSPIKRRVNIYVEPAHWRMLQTLNERTGAPVAELVRRAIDEYVTHHLSPKEVQAMRAEISKGAKKKRNT